MSHGDVLYEGEKWQSYLLIKTVPELALRKQTLPEDDEAKAGENPSHVPKPCTGT